MKQLFKLNTSIEGMKLDARWSGNTCSLTVTNCTDKELPLGDITLFYADMPFAPDTECYGEGYNMLAQYGGTIKTVKFLGSYSDYDHYKFYKPDGINQVYNMAIFYPKDKKPLLIGFTSCFRFNGWIRFNQERIEIALNGENIMLQPSQTISLEEVYIEEGDYETVIKRFAAAIAKNHPRISFPEIPTGWCSWLAYGPSITAQNIYDNLDAIKENGLNLKYIQIDDGYQAYWGDWLDFTDKFEGGVKKVCFDIKEKGFEPAIWVAPFVAEKDSKLFREHSEWFVKDENGAPLSSGDVSFGGWRCAPWYILDVTNPSALNYIKSVFSTMRNEWGIKYFKLDAIIWETMPYGVRYDKSKTGVEAYKIGLKAILEATGGDSFILGANAPMWPTIGMIHGMRVTNDNYRCWNTFTQIARECFQRNWQHMQFWINDPDTVLLQNREIEVVGPDGKLIKVQQDSVTDDEFTFNTVYAMASGGMVLSGDDVSKLTEKNIEILRRLLPSIGMSAKFEDTSFTVGRVKLNNEKTIVYLFNFDDVPKDIVVSVDGKVKVFDVFENEELGIYEDKIYFNGFKPHFAKALICKII